MTTVLEFPAGRAAASKGRDEQPAEVDRVELLERGVYRARWTIGGRPVLFAVKSNGDRLPSVVVLREGVSAPGAWHRLRRRLDRADPLGPRLHS